MKTSIVLATTAFALLLSAAALGIGSAVDTRPTLMSPADYSQARMELEAQGRLALARCREQSPGERELCRAEARAAERTAKATLDARYYGTVTAAAEARAARVKANFEVARARCVLRHGEERSDCMRAARADHNKLVAEQQLALN